MAEGIDSSCGLRSSLWLGKVWAKKLYASLNAHFVDPVRPAKALKHAGKCPMETVGKGFWNSFNLVPMLFPFPVHISIHRTTLCFLLAGFYLLWSKTPQISMMLFTYFLGFWKQCGFPWLVVSATTTSCAFVNVKCILFSSFWNNDIWLQATLYIISWGAQCLRTWNKNKPLKSRCALAVIICSLLITSSPYLSLFNSMPITSSNLSLSKWFFITIAIVYSSIYMFSHGVQNCTCNYKTMDLD